MNLADVQERLDYIDSIKGDYEAAHSEEDDLFRDFIEHVRREGSLQLELMAELVLTSKDIEFNRYTA
jgi:hypothetical protein